MICAAKYLGDLIDDDTVCAWMFQALSHGQAMVALALQHTHTSYEISRCVCARAAVNCMQYCVCEFYTCVCKLRVYDA